jgi:hypothetical protein
VLKWRAEDIVLAISGVVTTAAKGFYENQRIVRIFVCRGI